MPEMKTYPKYDYKPQMTQWLFFGAIKPAGWMRAQMVRDLEHGFVGKLDELVPDLIQRDDIYGSDRLTRATRTKELGVVSKEKEWEVQFLWWNSETQSNWRDGLLRATLLLDHPQYLPKIRAYVEHILATQDADGYLGIYAPDLRYNFNGENGELWAQATLLRTLLGYYEATGQGSVLDAVQRAVAVTMRAWPVQQAGPFTVNNDFAGVCHGLVFTDVLDRLYQLTGQESYLEYALWLYREYSKNTLSQDDIQLGHLLDTDYRFKAHGVHTYEHLRSLLTAVYASDSPELEKALDGYLEKLDMCLTPSGGPIGDEFIFGRRANASETGYEYCSIHELLDSYAHLLQKTGASKWADRLEWLYFNAGQGARHPQQSAIAYLKTDNSFSMGGPLHPDDPIDSQNPQTRYKYSPVHQDVAVCCVPNAGRITPYYVKAMWMRSEGGLIATLYGASQLQTEVKGVAVCIKQETNYPFDLQLTFTLKVAQPLEFELSFRKPGWASGFQMDGATPWREENDLISLRKTWQTGDIIRVRFETEVKVNSFSAEEKFISYGPLLFALPLDGIVRAGRSYSGEVFQDSYYDLVDADTGKDLSIIESRSGGSDIYSIERSLFDLDHPWEALALTGSLYDASTQQVKMVRLVPLGGTILRRATFGKV